MSQELSRRDLLAAFAATGGVFMLPTPAQASDITRTVAAARMAPDGFAPKIYTVHEHETVKALVDYPFPKDARGGSATEAGVPEFMDTFLEIEAGMRVAQDQPGQRFTAAGGGIDAVGIVDEAQFALIGPDQALARRIGDGRHDHRARQGKSREQQQPANDSREQIAHGRIVPLMRDLS